MTDLKATLLSQESENQVPRKSPVVTFLEGKGLFVRRYLAEGDLGKVKEAFSSQMGRHVAVKRVDRRRPSKMYMANILPRSIEVMSTLNHRNILNLYDVIETRQSVYLVLELAENGSLVDFINQRKYRNEKEIKAHFWQILQAVEYCHNQQLAHLDLKCENILLDEDLNIKISGFGLAEETGSQVHLSAYYGAKEYTCPEILREVPYDGKAADMWSLGVILFTMLSSRLPYHVTQLQMFARGHNIGLPQFQCGTSQDAKDLVSKLLAFDSAERISCQEAISHIWLTEEQSKLPSQIDISPTNKREQSTQQDDIVGKHNSVMEKCKTTLESQRKILPKIAFVAMVTINSKIPAVYRPMIADLKEDIQNAVVRRHIMRLAKDVIGGVKAARILEIKPSASSHKFSSSKRKFSIFLADVKKGMLVKKVLNGSGSNKQDQRKAIQGSDKRTLSFRRGIFNRSLWSNKDKNCGFLANFTFRKTDYRSGGLTSVLFHDQEAQGKLICERRLELNRLGNADSCQVAKEAAKGRRAPTKKSIRKASFFATKYSKQSLKDWQNKCKVLVANAHAI